MATNKDYKFESHENATINGNDKTHQDNYKIVYDSLGRAIDVRRTPVVESKPVKQHSNLQSLWIFIAALVVFIALVY